MNDAARYILDALHSHVWSGFDSPADVDQLIDDLLAGEADEASLPAVGPEFARKAAAKLTIFRVTNCDRLDAAFEMLEVHGIIALQNAGYTMSDGLTEVAEALHARGSREDVGGDCFYHGHDPERAVVGGGIMLAFGGLDDDPENKLKVGRRVREWLEGAGFVVQCNGNAKQRINLPGLDWKRRGPLA